MELGQKGLDLIKSFEGYSDKAYKCPAGIWTIGYGSTRYPNGEKVKEGEVCTKQQAEEYLKYEVEHACFSAIQQGVKVELNQNQLDAIISFIYNCGSGNFLKSTLLKKINLKDFQGASSEFLKWNKAGGKVLKGLTIRRDAERKLFLS